MNVYYDGSHSVSFLDPRIIGDTWRSVWERFHLIPASRPVIPPPPVKKSTIEVIGANTVIDLTEVPRGFPTYGNRTGTLDFYVDNSGTDYDWVAVYSEIKQRIHGKRLRMKLDDDPNQYYEGRFEISGWKTGKNISQISMDYDLDPFALSVFSTLEDPDPVQRAKFENLEVPAGESSGYVIYLSDDIGDMPVSPTFYVSDSDENGMHVAVYNTHSQKWSQDVIIHNTTIGIQDPALTLSTPIPGSQVQVNFSGSGKLSIDFRPGRL